MSNTFNFETKVAMKYQDTLSKVSVADAVTDTSLESELTNGTTVARDILDLTGARMRAGSRANSDRTIDEMTETQETIVVNKEFYYSTFLHDFDKLQSKHGIAEKVGTDLGIATKNFYDGTVLQETRNAYDTLDAGDVGGSAGAAITLATTNVILAATNGAAKLRANKVAESNFAWVVDPLMTAITEQYLAAKDTELGDMSFKNGYAGKVTRGLSVYESNSLTFSAKLAFGTNPTASDTITIGGVTFKFVASPSAAGDIDIGSDAAGSLANMVAAINGGAGAGTAYVELSAANRAILSGNLRCTATDGSTFMTIECVGSGRVVVSETLTAAGDVWSLQKIHSYMGKKNSIHVARQVTPGIKIMANPKNPRVSYLHTDMLWGQKTFADGKQRFLDMWVATV